MIRSTLAQEIEIRGVGLHSGQEVRLDLLPGRDGIVFEQGGIRIPARPEAVIDTRLNTMIGRDGSRVATIEHLMSALYGMAVTDCEIRVSGEELPAMDGSALPFLEQLKKAGTHQWDPAQRVAPIRITEPLRVENNDAFVEILPGAFSVTYGIDFPEPAIGAQSFTFQGADYETAIAPARTFGRLSEVEMMRAMGLALGGGLHNAIVVDGAQVLNPEGLRYADEFVRHKISDLLGDLWLLGRPVTGTIRAWKANHALHTALAARIARQACLQESMDD